MLTFDATDAVALVADEMVDTRRLLHAHPNSASRNPPPAR